MQFTLTPFFRDPPVCEFIYSCAVIEGSWRDLCSIADGSTHGIFDAITGNYEFYSTDTTKYPPGQYTFEITGTIGSLSTSTTFVMTLIDPCRLADKL